MQSRHPMQKQLRLPSRKVPLMKITKELTLTNSPVEFEGALPEERLKEIFAQHGLPGFKAELDIAERTEDHVQMVSLNEMLEFCKAAGMGAVVYDVTYFPHADEAEVDRQVKQLAKDLQLSPKVIHKLCAQEIREYIALDAQRNTSIPVHSIVEGHTNGTAIAWYGVNEYPRLKKIVLNKLKKGDGKNIAAFARRAAEMQMEMGL